jgi:ABC-type nitrate/sulfonate/bicarbonate transport system substrate-binding protein
MRASRGIALVIVLASTVAFASCASEQRAAAPAGSPAADECGPLEEMTAVTLGVNPGAQDLVTQAIEEQGFDEKYNLDLKISSFENPPASAQAVTQKAVDIGFGGVTTMAQARARGLDVFLFGALASPSNGVFVREDSDIEDIGDLAGARFGSFSANNSATFAVLSAIASEGFGMGKLEDELASLVTAPDAALVGLLGQGELDAILLGSTATVVTQLEDKYRQIGDLSTEYEDATGIAPVHLALTTTDSYAADHCSELVAFSNAMRDGTKYVQENDEAWENYAETLELSDPNAPEALQELLGANFRTEWDEEQVEGITAMLESFIPILGEEEFISEVPEGLFRLDYVATDE